MKKHLLFIIAAAALLLASCANESRNSLRLAIEEVNKECPIDNNNMVLESTSYDDDNNAVVLNYNIKKESTDLTKIRKSIEQQKAFLINYFNGDDINTEFKDKLVEAEADIRYVYRENGSPDSVVIFISAKEIKDAISAADVDEDNDLRQLESMVAISNAQCPQRLDEGLEMTSATIDGNYIVFNIAYNKDMYDVLATDVSQLHEALTAALREDLTAQTDGIQLGLMKKLGIGVKYTYTASDGSLAPVVVVIEPAEVAAY